MVTGIVIFAAVSLVVVAVQFSCLFAHQASKEKGAEAPAEGCPEV